MIQPEDEDMSPADRTHMQRALELAERGWGRVHPNPLVGAVVVAGGEVVGEGFHGEFGGPHAEVVALEEAGERARGATLYVTLEPCAHHGKTPACTDAVRAAGIGRVVYAAADPGAESGGGGEMLAEAGVDVVGGVLRHEARRQNAAFFHAAERSDPYVALKFGLSLDARIAEAPGRTTAVTGGASWREVHRLRAGFDAILVGSGTARVDDPLLTVRGDVEPRVPPRRVILDTEASLPLESRLARTVDEAPVTVVCAEDADTARVEALEREGVRVLRVRRGAVTGAGGLTVPGAQSRTSGISRTGGSSDMSGAGGATRTSPSRGLDVNHALSALWADGVRSILCEGGGRLAASLLEADRVARLYLFFAPRLLGGAAVPAFPLARPAPRGWRVWASRAIGGDVLVEVDRDRDADSSDGEAPRGS